MELFEKNDSRTHYCGTLTKNDIGNAFWNTIGWTKRLDLNYYDFTLNEANITEFNK